MYIAQKFLHLTILHEHSSYDPSMSTSRSKIPANETLSPIEPQHRQKVPAINTEQALTPFPHKVAGRNGFYEKKGYRGKTSDRQVTHQNEI